MRVGASIFAAVVALAALDNPNMALATTIGGITLTGQFLFIDDKSINDVAVGTGVNFSFGGHISERLIRVFRCGYLYSGRVYDTNIDTEFDPMWPDLYSARFLRAQCFRHQLSPERTLGYRAERNVES